MEQAGAEGKEEKSGPWTVHDAKVNLAALLNDPRKTRRDYDLFTKTWGESFKELPPGASVSKSLRVPHITEAHFRDHLSKTRDKFLRHQSQYMQDEAGEGDEKKQKDVFKSKFDFRRKSYLPPQNYAVYALQQQKKVQAATRQALDSIPKLFLRPEFALENPHTFNSVLHFSASSGSSDSHSNPKANKHSVVKHEMSSSKLLQEKLSHYLDMVEVAIVRQISIQSDAFFDAMTSHEDLNEYLTKMLGGVHQLRVKITSIRDNINKKSFEVVHLHCQRRNRAILLDKLRTMITVHQAQPTIQLLLSTTEYAGALDLIETTQEVLKRELAGLHCFRHLGSQLSEMESIIGHMMAEELSSCIQNDLHRPLKEGPLTLNPHHLTAIALGLLRRKQLDFVEEYREEVKFAVKAIIKTTVMDAVIAAEEYLSPEECKDDENVQAEGQEDEDGSPKERTESLAERMRLLTFEEWIVLLSNIFSNLTLFLRRVCSFLSVIVNVACVSTSPAVRKAISDQLKNSQASTTGRSDGETDRSNHNVGSAAGHVEETSPNGQIVLPAEEPLPNPLLGNQEHSDVTDNVWDDMDQYEAQLMESAVTNLNDDVRVKNGTETVQNAVADGPVNAKTEGKEDSGSISDENPSPDSYGIATSRDILLSEEEHNELMQSICENLVWTADFSHDRCVKVIIAKNKNSSLEKLTSSEFLSLAQSIEKYLADTDEVTFGSPPDDADESTQYFAEYFSAYFGSGSRGGGVLRGVLQSQASRFITRFHEERRNKLSLILDNETWKQSEVPTELAALLRKLSTNHATETKNEVAVNGTSTTKALSVLTLDGTEYAVVGTVLLLLKMVSEYISCADDLPASTPDLVTRVSELLTLFNSRTCQLVLGAGALQLAGLKTISTRNLGLASRCLQLVLYLMPSIQRQFKEKLISYCQSTKNKHLNVLKHFAHVVKDYEDHITEIDSKLVTIMDSAMENNLSKWQVKAPTPSEEFRAICRQIAKLHEMIADLLPEDQISRLLLEIHVRFKKLLRRKLQQYNVRNNGSPKHGLVMSDVAFYQGSVKEMKIFDGVDLKMDSVWT